MAAESSMHTGMVSSHALTMVPTRPHLTAENRTVLPTPIMEVEITWVVLIGIPNADEEIITPAASRRA